MIMLIIFRRLFHFIPTFAPAHFPLALRLADFPSPFFQKRAPQATARATRGSLFHAPPRMQRLPQPVEMLSRQPRCLRRYFCCLQRDERLREDIRHFRVDEPHAL